jgi:hypothetical protein
VLGTVRADDGGWMTIDSRVARLPSSLVLGIYGRDHAARNGGAELTRDAAGE